MKLLALFIILAIIGMVAQSSDLHCYTYGWDLRLHEVRCLRAEDDYGGAARSTATATPEIILPPMEPTATPTEMPLPYPSPEPYP